MLHITNRRTLALGVSALGLAAAGISITILDNGSAQGQAAAGATAGPHGTATAEAYTAELGGRRATRTSLSHGAVNASTGAPTASIRTAGRRAPGRPIGTTSLSGRTSPAATALPPRSGLVSIDVRGPVNAHVDSTEILTTARTTVLSTLQLATDTVRWTKSTVDRTVRSLPVTASVTTGKDGTTASASAAGVGATAHVG